jgi:hypothetical protein
MIEHPSRYLMGRLSPFGSSALEWLTDSNWRGEKVSTADVLKEAATKAIPASLKFLPGVSDADEWGTGHRSTTSHLEQFLTSQGLKVGRDSPLNAAYQLANDYKKRTGVDDKAGVYPVSKYQQLRYALEDGDMAKAGDELDRLKTGRAGLSQIIDGFHSSVFHAWTGSSKIDREFLASLASDDRAKVDKAEAHRQAIWAKFIKLAQPSKP